MPRSASRDHSDRYENNRDYFHAPDWLKRAKKWALVTGLALTVLWALVDYFHPQGSSYHTHGALANPHAMWDSKCDACHKSHGIGDFGLASIFDTHDRWHDLTCTKCHAGPAHHNTATAKGQEFHNDCSNCHHDHAGRTASLTRISDAHCVRCHGDLSKHHKDGTASFQNVTAFAKPGHPEFALIHEYGSAGEPTARPYEPRRLKFSHALHMTPGIVLAAVSDEKKGTSSDSTWTPKKIDELHAGADPTFRASARERYNRGNLSAAIQLACADCHQLDSGYPNPPDPAVPPDDPSRRTFDQLTTALLHTGEPRRSVLPPRAEGAYYLPVNFEAHCMTCHPLRAPDGVADGKVITGFPVPHRAQPAELKLLLDGKYGGRLVGQNPPVASLPGPGDLLDKANAATKAAFSKDVERLTADAFRDFMLNATPVPPVAERGKAVAPAPDEFRVRDKNLYGGYACGKCHYTTEASTGQGAAQIARLPQHTVWFAHATFNHVSHRGVECASCHPGTAKPKDPPGRVVETEPLAIRGVDSCRGCHAPAGKMTFPDKPTTPMGGIRHDCTDCHRYHNGDRPLQGLGAPARDPADPNKLHEFLGGGK